ncbi:hypothetical protein WMQ48_18940 [Vibrio cidicii]|uniref:hypothetical protein n=1 Tax=Vibrio cidicii TaxID=1763883 RepID=UPI003750138F
MDLLPSDTPTKSGIEKLSKFFRFVPDKQSEGQKSLKLGVKVAKRGTIKAIYF